MINDRGVQVEKKKIEMWLLNVQGILTLFVDRLNGPSLAQIPVI